MSVSPELLERLKSSRFAAGPTLASGGPGERRSRMTGAGIEFASYRNYRDGDDTRHIDPHLYARTGEHYVRQYFTDRQLSVTVLMDGSTSMHGAKFDTALRVAELAGFVALTAGDRVRFAVTRGPRLESSPRLSGKGRLEEMRRWLAAATSGGSQSFANGIRSLLGHVSEPGLILLISDFWDLYPDGDLAVLGEQGHAVVALHLLGAEELDPTLLDPEAAALVDAETDERCDITLGSDALRQYRDALETWCAGLRRGVERRGGRLFRFSPETDLDKLFLTDFRHARVLT